MLLDDMRLVLVSHRPRSFYRDQTIYVREYPTYDCQTQTNADIHGCRDLLAGIAVDFRELHGYTVSVVGRHGCWSES
jgi:hypothetical protein